MNSDELSQILDTNHNRNLLIIDCRSLSKYSESHIHQSLHISRCPILWDRIRSGKLSLSKFLLSNTLEENGKLYEVVLYSFDYKDDFMKEVAKNLSNQEEIVSISFLRDGYKEFREMYPRHCSLPRLFQNTSKKTGGFSPDKQHYLNCQLCEIEPYMYLGALHDAQDGDLIQRYGFTHILNCSRENYSPKEGIEYLFLDYMDNFTQRLDDKLEVAFDFIDKAKKNGKVLIHCYAGISRAPSVVIAYLMTKKKKSYDEIHTYVKAKRPIIDPNINFIMQLMHLETNITIDNALVEF